MKKYLGDTVKRVVKKIEEEKPEIQFFQVYGEKNADKILELKLPLNNIIYFEVINREIYMYTVYGKFRLYHYKFSDIVRKFIALEFLDIHRTCIVNAKFVISVGETTVYLDNGQELIMSRRKRKQVLDSFLDDIYREGQL